MTTPLRVLIIEDSENDTELLLRELRRGGYAPEYERVETPEGLEDALTRQPWDLIISDYAMPRFNGVQALKLIQAKGGDIPFILVSGLIGEDVAVEAMKAGAHDYLMKDKLARLLPAIERELREAVMRQEGRQAEEKIRQLHTELNQFKNTLDQTLEAVYIFDPDTLRFTYVNEGAKRQTGYSQTELMQMTLLDIKSELTLEQFRQTMQPLVDGVQPLLIFETVHRHKDGHDIPVEVSRQLIRLEGQAPRFVSMVTDITERKQAENTLRESEQRLRLIIETEPECVKVVSPQGRLLEMNAAGLAMLEADSLSEAQNGLLIDFILPEYRDAFNQLNRRVMHGESGTLEFEVRGLRGTRRWLETHAAPMRDATNEVVSVLAVTRDITERKQAEEEIFQLNTELEERVQQRTAQLQTANQELEAFSYSVSHDLRSPLSVIDGYSGLLDKEIGASAASERGKHYLARIRAGVVQMGELIDALLSLAQVSRTSLRRESVDLSALAETVLNDCREREPGRLAQFDIQPGLLVQGDPGLLRQVLDNLLGNAWKYSSKQPQTHIIFRRESGPDGAAVFTVRDHGAGFDMAYSDKLFGAFQRLHNASEFEGTGVGLATVHKIITRHGGRIWAESAPGQGATFYFTLGA